MSAGVGNDVVGWILLALCVALVNSGAGLTALWILLVAVGYILFLVFLVRPVVIWFLRRTGSLANGPTQTVVALTILLVLASAFFTGIIGIHPIFGAFIIGLLLPHEGGFAIKLTEKIEDLVSVLFLPLYFALSGLSTNLGLLNNGKTWAYVVGVCAIAFTGKIAGGTLAARLNGLVWRESFTIGALMSCKGLVELIVLNIGLQAHILSTRTFTIFVVMALVTTFATTPLVSWLYPPWYQRKLELWKQGKIDWDGNLIHHEDDTDTSEADMIRKTDAAKRILVYLRLDGLPSLFTMVNLFSQRRENTLTAVGPDSGRDDRVVKNAHALNSVTTLHRPLQIHGLRLMELTERESSVMRVSEIEEFAGRDPVIKALGTFGQSRDVAVGAQIAVVPDYSFSGTLLSRARDLKSDLVLIPWSETGTMSEYPSLFDTKPGDPLANRQFSALAAEMFERAQPVCHVGVVIDKTVLCTPTNGQPSKPESPVADRPIGRQLSRTLTGISLGDNMNSTVHFKLSDNGRHRIVALYQSGSEDDIFAVRMALQFAKNDLVDLTILNVRHVAAEVSSAVHLGDGGKTGTKQTTEQPSTDDEFDVMRSTIATSEANERIVVVDTDALALESVTSVLAEPSSAETLVLVGRGTAYLHLPGAHHSGHAEHGISSSSGPTSAREDSRALGPFSTQMVKVVRERQIATSILVVQAKRDGEGHDPDGLGGFSAAQTGGPKEAKGLALTKKLSHMSDE